MKRHMLYSNEMDLIVEDTLNKNNAWEKKEVQVTIPGLREGMNVTYFYNKSRNVVIIPSPLAVKASNSLEMGIEPSYEATRKAIAQALGNEQFGIGCTLLGKGSTERHYTTLYREADTNGQLSIFDSKISNPSRYLDSSDAPNPLEKIWAVITAPFKIFGRWAFGIGKQTQASFLTQNVTIHRLGTQPLFDGVSCGYHSAGALLEMVDMIDRGRCNTEAITLSITTQQGLDEKAEKILIEIEERKKSEPFTPHVSTALHTVSVSNGSVVHKEEHVPSIEANGKPSSELPLRSEEPPHSPTTRTHSM